MKRKAVINEAGEVENVILCGDDFSLPGKTLIETEEAGPGWRYEAETFIPPA